MWLDSRTAPYPVQYTRTPCTSATARCVSAVSLSTRGTRTHSDTRDTSHAVHFKPPFLKRVSSAFCPLLARFLLPLGTRTCTLRTYAGGSRTSSSVSSGRAARDVLWERALSALPPELLSALRAAELDDPRVLSEYPVESLHDLEEYVGGKVEIGGAPSGAASSAHSTLSSSHSCSLPTGPSGSASPWDG